MTKKRLRPRQKKFVAEYIKTHGNAAAAYRNAGYKAKSGRQNAKRLIEKPEIQEYLSDICGAAEKEDIADANEVLRYLTAVMRGEHLTEQIVIIGTGKGHTKAETIDKKPDEKEQLEAAKTLAKFHGLYKNELNVNGGFAVQILDDIPDEPEEGGTE